MLEQGQDDADGGQDKVVGDHGISEEGQYDADGGQEKVQGDPGNPEQEQDDADGGLVKVQGDHRFPEQGQDGADGETKENLKTKCFIKEFILELIEKTVKISKKKKQWKSKMMQEINMWKI